MVRIEDLVATLVTKDENQDKRDEVVEYFKRNIGDFNDVFVDSKTYNNDAVQIYHLDQPEPKYVLVKYDREEELIEYRVEKSCSINDIIDNNQSVIHFWINFPVKTPMHLSFWVFRKQIYTGEFAIDEAYHPGECFHIWDDYGDYIPLTSNNIYDAYHYEKSVVAQVYSKGTFLKVIHDNSLEAHPVPIVAHGNFLALCTDGRQILSDTEGFKSLKPDEPLETIVVRESCVLGNKKIYEIYCYNGKGELLASSKTVTGTSLYNVYYDYMIEKGYFVGDGQKEGEMKKVKT